MKYFLLVMRYVSLAGQLLAAIQDAKAGKIDADLRGIRFEGDTWDLRLTGARRDPDAKL